jgi:hypothetical protein
LAHAAPLAIGDLLDGSHVAGQDLVEPSVAWAIALTSLARVSARIGRLSGRDFASLGALISRATLAGDSSRDAQDDGAAMSGLAAFVIRSLANRGSV